jgi:putative endonuclease
MFNFWKSKSLTPVKFKTLGQLGEELAQAEYKKLGYKIIAQNEYNKKGKRLGEVDFIATQGNKIIFVEVKTRAEEKGFFGNALDAVDIYKQRKILKAVKIFLIQNQQYKEFNPQIDVCVVIMRGIDPVRGRHASGMSTVALGQPASNGVDKAPESVKIYSSVVEDWN